MNGTRAVAATLVAASFAQGCASTHPGAPPQIESPAEGSRATIDCAREDCGPQVLRIASGIEGPQGTEVPIEKNAPPVKGHPLTSVVVTQCNLIVAVYVTMPDGMLLRFDHTAKVPADQLIAMAYTATRSERVEVSCNDEGAVGYERHDPT